MKKHDTPLSQKGIGLLEILISLLIGSILILAITTMYGNFISASKLQQEQSTAQDQANFAFLELNRAVRMAGAGLCVNPRIEARTYTHQTPGFRDVFPPLIPNNLTTFNAASRLHSFSNPTKEQLGISLSPPTPQPEDADEPVTAGSDALIVIYSDPNTRRITGINGASAGQTSAFHARELASPRTNQDIVFNDSGPTWIMLSDCEHTGIFRYAEADGKAPPVGKAPAVNSNILAPPEGGSFLYNFGGNGQNVLIAKLHAQLYFVAKSRAGINHLYKKDLLGSDTNAKPIAAYIDKMTIEYQDPTSKIWESSTSRSDWNDNRPVRITLTTNVGHQLGEQTFTRILGVRN